LKQILVIEDDPNILDNIAQILELYDYAVLQASNGRIGLSLAIEKCPDLIMCDIMMPEVDGYEVLSELRVRGLIDVPFIFLTARAEKSAQLRGMDIGADDYITKPFTLEDLLSVVESRLTK
jgi:two-component system, sensor histidine kinase and response regulator